MRAFVSVGIALGFLVSDAVAQQGLPPEVRAAQAEHVTDCRNMKGRLTIDRSAYVLTADFNGDGRTDYVLDEHAVSCDTALSQYCGSAGCGHQVFLSLPNGRYDKPIYITGEGVKIETRGGRAVLHFAGDGQRADPVWGWSRSGFKQIARE